VIGLEPGIDVEQTVKAFAETPRVRKKPALTLAPSTSFSPVGECMMKPLGSKTSSDWKTVFSRFQSR
jgi:hypothetical protein